MSTDKFIYKDAKRYEINSMIIWKLDKCMQAEACCIHSSNNNFGFDTNHYKQKCPNFIGVEEDGIMCKISNAIDFILSS